MKTDNIDIKVDGSGLAELTIRHGDALPQVQPKPFNILALIGAPAEYVKKRAEFIPFSTTHVLVNPEAGEITLVINDDCELRSTVTGKIQVNPDFNAFKINGSDWASPKELGEFLRKNRMFFPDKEQFVHLVDSLLNFKARVEREIEKGDDKRGGKRDIIIQNVTTQIPAIFDLQMPLHRGCEPVRFEVEVFFEVRDDGTRVSLQSIGAKELQRAEVEEIVKRELPAFEVYPVIYI